VFGGVFISYRRQDSDAWAGRIYDRLARQFDAKSVFLDVDNIQPGLDFEDELSKKLSLCDVLVAVIGRNWNSSVNEDNRRRLDDPNDFVRLEIEAALQRGIRLIPVLVDGATMPRREELPESLQKLRRRHGIEVSHNRFAADVERLIHALSLIEEELRQRQAAEAERAEREDRERREAAEATQRSERERWARQAAEAERAALKEREGRGGRRAG
jgi:TIR domain